MILCACCNQPLDTGEIPPFDTGVRVSRFVECAHGTVTNISALRGDATWTAVSNRAKAEHAWVKLPDADAFYTRLGELVPR